MEDELSNIFSQSDGEIDNDKLLKYLNGELTPEENHEVEKEMISSGMMNDAVEGLQSVPNRSKLKFYEKELQSKLKKQLQKRDQKRESKKIKELPWLYIAIVIVILLVIISYAIIHHSMQQ